MKNRIISSDLLPCPQRRAEDVHVPQADRVRDTAERPVVDALHAVPGGVESKDSREFGRAAQGVDDCFVRMCAHVAIKRHV